MIKAASAERALCDRALALRLHRWMFMHIGDHSSRAAQLQARENAAGFGIATASGAWRSVGRALARIPKQEADQAREAQLARLQAVRMLLWNQANAGDRSRWRHTAGDHPAGDGAGESADGGRYAGTGTAAARP
jgi:hypothetical protein